MCEYDKYLECLDNEPDTVEENLKQVNKFVNNNCTVDELWAHFAQPDELHADLVITSSLLYASLKWQYEIFQQRPLEPTEAKAELIKLLDQLHIDKPHIFKDSFISLRFFCELAHYLKLMYAGNLSSEDDEKSAFENEEDIPVLAFDRADEFSNQKLPSLPFPCLIVDSSSAKAWTTALKKLNHAEINDLRGEIGNAIDWNKLNDTFLVDFKGSMFWLPRNSIQPAEEHTGSGTGSRSEAETAPSITVEGHRSEGRTTEPDEDNSILSPFLHRLQNKFQSTGVFTQRLYAVVKGSPVTADNDENVEHSDYAPFNSLDDQQHNRSYSHQPRNRVCEEVSLADFLVIAAEAVMDRTRKEATKSKGMAFADQFKFGRETKTEKKCAVEHGLLPNPRKGCEELERVFETNLKLSRRGTVALLGVHTLGKAEPRFSGFDGWWSDSRNSRMFNNNYYISIIAKGWEPVKLNGRFLDNERIPDEVQWMRSDNKRWVSNEMMLDTDMCLAFGDALGESLIAQSDNCCGYLSSTINNKYGPGVMKDVIDNNKGEFCGKSVDKIGSEKEHDLCCGRNKTGEDFPDCGGNASDPVGGWATSDVVEFAANETMWLDEFMVVWKKATENGASGLEKLRKQC